MVQLTGKYNLESSDNFDEFLKVLGVGFMLRQLIKTSKPSIEVIEHEDGSISIKLITFVKTTVVTFKLGEEFDETLPDGKTCKSLVVKERDNKLVHTQKGEKFVTVVREFCDKALKMTFSCDGVTSTRIFKRIV